MIDFLRGLIVHKEADHIVLDVHGVGYRVFCSNPYAFEAEPNQETTAFIHHHVREDAIFLFGFATRDEQSLFRSLLEVSGIGPRVAMGILSGGRPEALIAAIAQEDIVYLTRLPGIGKKTAQRMILDLKDKFDKLPASQQGIGAAAGSSAQAANSHRWSGAWAETKEALLALGYTEAEADRVRHALKSTVKDTDSVDTLLKAALQILYKG